MQRTSNALAVILVVDDDPLTLTGVAAVLALHGFECHCARDPQAALKAARSLPLDLLICNVNLSGVSGLELCRDLKRRAELDDIPAMFISSAQIPDVLRRADDAGGTYYLRKPFDPNVLAELVEQVLCTPHAVDTRVEAGQRGPYHGQVARPHRETLAGE